MRAARQKLNLNQEGLGEKWGLSGNYVSMLELGTKPIGSKYHARIFELEEEVRKKFESRGGKYSEGKESGISVREGEPMRERAPVVSWASAGQGGNYADMADQIDEWVDTDSKDPNKYALIVEGDSMETKFSAGDRIVVEPNREAQNGNVVVARLRDSGQVLLKLYHEVEKGVVRLTSFNHQFYPPLTYQKSDFRFIHPVRNQVRKW